ncbi:hypothetical protein [Pedobacter sp. MC2016-24]|uniref:hypothetical protein n=1 Tax=Pedobacter sp. MC2016-24 TaxID=2780090 RepID=UPI0018809D61|nr:hypothetical protein [Pedobacter sp. MC2016-24]MBE9601374.1 hypothetical protein [Pedobacter sp. MC2016-24]
MKISSREYNGMIVLTGENDQIRFEIIPAMGGKLASVFNKTLNKEFLWHNEGLDLGLNAPGTDYDSHFLGGVDELLPNDIPETIDSLEYPDHGELWTTSLQYEIKENKLIVYGKLAQSGLFYRKTLSLQPGSAEIHLDYQMINESGHTRHFLWKLHAALKISAGDHLLSSARKAKVVYPEASRFSTTDEFNWPLVEGHDAALVPEKNGSMDFFYLYEALEGEMGLISGDGKHLFAYRYDQQVFPFQWYFASYGQFDGHYTAILEPASAMPVSVNEAMKKQQCTVLAAGQQIETRVTIYAGELSSSEINDRY